MEINDVAGRLLLDNELTPELRQQLAKQAQPAIISQGKFIVCQRCLTRTPKLAASLPNGQYYCPACLLLGRVSSANQLYHLSERNLFSPLQQSPLVWQGKLSAFQAECSAQLSSASEKTGRYLLWAVTGAGKTEMLFPTLEKAFLAGKRVCLASPRVDVCNELYPRLCAAFTGIEPTLLHGHTKQVYHYSQLTICTTHQLLRFQHAFDLLIIDEVDAFPFRDNQMLGQAATRAVKPAGCLVYLTATPTPELLALVKRGQLSVSYLPLRFHQHLLPVPVVWLLPNWQRDLAACKLPLRITRVLQKWGKSHQPFLVFVPSLRLLLPVLEVLQQLLPPAVRGESVYSADAQRIEKVQALRDHRLNYLVTTTILERGVTFPALNVLVLGADHQTFSTAALVQIAGRVGRSAEHPTGEVLFICSDHVKNVRAALQQIQGLNRKGEKLLHG